MHELEIAIVLFGVFRETDQIDLISTRTHERIFHQSSVTEIVPVKLSQAFTILSLSFKFTLDGVHATIWIGKKIGSCPGILIEIVSSPATKFGINVILRFHLVIKNESLAWNQLPAVTPGIINHFWLTTVTAVSNGRPESVLKEICNVGTSVLFFSVNCNHFNTLLFAYNFVLFDEIVRFDGSTLIVFVPICLSHWKRYIVIIWLLVTCGAWYKNNDSKSVNGTVSVLEKFPSTKSPFQVSTLIW